MPESAGQYSAVYVSWATFQGALKQLSQALPNQIDRTVFPGLSWNVQNQLFTGLKFLGLTNDAGRPAPVLATLLSDDEKMQKQRLSGLLHEKYVELFKLDLVKASPLQIQQAMSEHYGVSGDTLEKAIRFFVAAAEYCGIPMSPLLAGKRPDGTMVRKRRGPARAKKSIVDPPSGGTSPTNGSEAKNGTSKTVGLESGGSLTLSATLDLFALNPKDRSFIFELIDRLEKYERDSVKMEKPEGGVSSAS